MINLIDVGIWLEAHPGTALHVSVTRGQYLVWLMRGSQCQGLAVSHVLARAIHEAIEDYTSTDSQPSGTVTNPSR